MRRGLFAAGAFLLTAASAGGYQFVSVDGKPQRWPEGRATFFTDPAMAPDRVKSMRSAAETWSTVPGSSFRFHYGGPSPSADLRSLTNGNNDIYFDPGLPPFVYAVTASIGSGEALREKDIVFNSGLTWTTNGSPAGAADVETVALHELGHALGLMHEDSVPSVMHASGDASIPNRALYPDDEAGVRFLYPGGGGGVSPARVDLAAGVLTITSGSPGPGRRFSMTVEAKDLNPAPSGPFRVVATLSPGLPVSPRDEEIGSNAVPSLQGGDSTTVDLSPLVPDGSAPGVYRVGVFLDPEDDVRDPDRSNNSAVTEPFTVTRPPFYADLGDAVDAPLGPLGSDAAEVWIGGGTEVTVRARGTGGVRPVIRVRAAGQEAVLGEAPGGRSAVLRWTAPVDGVYFIELANAAVATGRVRARTAGRFRLLGLDRSAPGEVPFPAYAGGTVLLSAVYSGDGSVPASLGCRVPAGIEVTSPGILHGPRAGFGPFAPAATGVHALLLHGSGPARCTVLSLAPRRGTLIRR